MLSFHPISSLLLKSPGRPKHQSGLRQGGKQWPYCTGGQGLLIANLVVTPLVYSNLDIRWLMLSSPSVRPTWTWMPEALVVPFKKLGVCDLAHSSPSFSPSFKTFLCTLSYTKELWICVLKIFSVSCSLADIPHYVSVVIRSIHMKYLPFVEC